MRLQEFASWDARTERKQGEELDQLLRGDFRCIAAYLKAAMPHTDHEVRKVPFVRRYASELSGLYQRPVVRRFVAPSDPQTLPAQAWQKLGQAYADGGFDATMSTVEQAIWVQQTQAVVAMPDGYGVRLRAVSPWQMNVKVADGLRASDPAGWESVEIQIPDAVNATDGSVTYGTLYFTAKEAWIRTAGKQRGVYQPNGGHTFGRIPIALAHIVDPVDGHPFAPVNEAVHNLQLALCQHESETELVVRHSSWPQKVLENASIGQLTETLQLGADKVVALMRSGDPGAPGPTLRVVQGQLPVTELAAYIDGRIKLYCAMLGIDPSAFLRVNTAVTVSARMFADSARREMRDRVRPTLLRLERDIARLAGWVLSESGAIRIPWQILDVDVRWQDWSPSPDPVAEATATRARMQLGLESVVDQVAMREGLSRTAALKVVQDRLLESRALGLIADPHEPTESSTVENAEESDANLNETESIGDAGRQDDQAADSESDGNS